MVDLETEAPALRVLRLNIRCGNVFGPTFEFPELRHHLEELALFGVGFNGLGVWPRLKKLTLEDLPINATDRWAPCLEELHISPRG